jgi:hypothetical protein
VTIAHDHVRLSPATSDPLPRQAVVPTGPVAPQDVHVLRLCLDLQLDALLHTVGASAAARVSQVRDERKTPEGQANPPQPHTYSGLVAGDPEVGHGPDPEAVATVSTPLPWRRWLAEDVELACTMAAGAMATDAIPPAELGTDLTEADPVEVVDDLLARYRSMQPMLTGLAQGAGLQAGPWRTLLRSTLARCEQRIDELQAHRDDLVSAGAPSAPSSGWSQSHVPGDYLG